MIRKLFPFFTWLMLLTATLSVKAQQFIEKGTIEYEVKTNLKKKFASFKWLENFQENLPQSRTDYFKLSFAGNRSLYKLSARDEKNKVPEWLDDQHEDNEWFSDYGTQTMHLKKVLVGAPFFIRDSLPVIRWKLLNESMNIAGFNCRKAMGRIFDSVYVFVFYTEEIPLSGGPCSINGLPGMILGMTIPRLYTSWMATKVVLTDLKPESLQPAPAKKEQPIAAYRDFLIERTKDWGGSDASGYKEQFLWSALL